MSKRNKQFSTSLALGENTGESWHKTLRRNVNEALSGKKLDLTEAPLSKAIFLLSLPMVLEMIMESIFALVDIFFVSKLGAEAIATVGITESMVTIVYSLGIGLSAAATGIIARRIGEKKPKEASVAAVQAIIAAIGVSFIIAIPGAFFAPELLEMMGAEQKIVEEFYHYTAILLGGNVIIMLLFVINGIFRSAGDPALSMRVLWIGNGINIVLNPCLIFGWGPFPELGIIGAAIATNIGRGIAVMYQFYILFSGKSRIQLKLSDFGIHKDVMFRLFKLSLGGIGQSLIITTSWIVMVRIVSEFGSIATAGYTVAIRIIIFALLPSWGLSNASATLVGQNLGANKPDRAEKSVWATAKINMMFLGTLSVFFMAIPHWFVGLLIDNPEIIEKGAICLRIMSYGYIFYAAGMVIVHAFNGAGDTMTPTKVNIFCFWLLEIPLAYLLAIKLGVGEDGVYYSIIIAETVMTIAGIYFFRKGNWKKKSV